MDKDGQRLKRIMTIMTVIITILLVAFYHLCYQDESFNES